MKLENLKVLVEAVRSQLLAAGDPGTVVIISIADADNYYVCHSAGNNITMLGLAHKAVTVMADALEDRPAHAKETAN